MGLHQFSWVLAQTSGGSHPGALDLQPFPLPSHCLAEKDPWGVFFAALWTLFLIAASLSLLKFLRTMVRVWEKRSTAYFWPIRECERMSQLCMEKLMRVLLVWKLNAWVRSDISSPGLRVPKPRRLMASFWPRGQHARYGRSICCRVEMFDGAESCSTCWELTKRRCLRSMPFELFSASVTAETWYTVPREIET